MLVMYMLHASTTTAIQTSRHTVITVYDLLSINVSIAYRPV